MPRYPLPNNWAPRPDQLPLWSYLEHGGKRAAMVAHRRWGKDDVALHFTACAAMERPATYWHMLPEYEQARKAIWTAVNALTGKRRIDEAFPQEIRASTDDRGMFIRFRNGSTWQVVGSDNYNNLVGAGTAGMVFSEWALADPNSWGYFRPMVKQNKGWGLFIYTPRGRNHGLKTYERSVSSPEWFGQKIDARHSPVFTAQELEEERLEYMDALGDDDGEQMFAQEYLCSFDAPLVGSFYGRALSNAEMENRVCVVPYDPDLPVHVSFDIGKRDDTALWFFQQFRSETRVIDFYSANGFGPEHYAQIMQERKYVYGQLIMPHDAENKVWVTDQTPAQSMRRYGYKVIVLPQSNILHGINAGRKLIKMALFDKVKCRKGIEALRNYKREWDEKHKVFRDNPLHDWSSHAADSWRYAALGLPRQNWADAKSSDRYSFKPRSDRPTSWMGA